jgi:diguanylate cyclase (GGDEF)-like protein/PAS domain S-box-containing protein
MADSRVDQEAKRLKAVHDLQILDTPPESDFDDLVKLAALIFKVPISTITIVDGHRQWFKASLGLPFRETPRDISFCSHTIEAEAPFVVPDAMKDPRFSSSPLVAGEPYLGFYAGVSLRNPQNLAVGTFCIMDKIPRNLSERELKILALLGHQVVKLLELRYQRNQLKQLIEQRDKINKNLQESEQRWKFALEGSGDGVWDWDIQTNTVFFSDRWKEMLGYQSQDISNDYDAWLSLIHQDDIGMVLNKLKVHLADPTEQYKSEFRALRKDSEWQWVMSRGLVVQWDDAGQPSRMVGTHTDISARKETEATIWKQANFDSLTGLPNRRMFFDRLTEEIKRSMRSKKMFGLMFIDLDGFKGVNDVFGHQAGDQLLVQVSRRLNQTIRDTDTSARLGGDEFTVLLPGLSHQSDVERIADKILQALNAPYKWGKKTATISASIGIAIFPKHGLDGDTLISHADTAMYEAKEIGKNCWVMFDSKPER